MTNHTLQKQVFRSGTLLAALAVVLGAFGAHSLKERIDEHSLLTFETGVRYLLIHAIGILFIGAFLRKLNEKIARQAWFCFLLGIGLFSGSLLLLSTRSLWIGDAILWTGGITPVGGIFFIAGWLRLFYNGYKSKESPGEPGTSRHHSRSRSSSRVRETETGQE